MCIVYIYISTYYIHRGVFLYKLLNIKKMIVIIILTQSVIKQSSGYNNQLHAETDKLYRQL